MPALFDGWRKYLLLPAALILAVGLGAGCSDDDDKGTDPVLGACCDEEGNCGVLTKAQCDAERGDWHRGLTCNPDPCDPSGPVPLVGACCDEEGACQVLTEAGCDYWGGEWHEGLTCNPNPCDQDPAPPVFGACCMEGGTCGVLTEAQCQEFGGVWHRGLLCDPNPCDPDPDPDPDPVGQISFTFGGTQYTSHLCMAHYMIDDGETSITSGDGGANWALTFEFPGSSTGSFTAADGVSAMFVAAADNFWYRSEEFAVTVSAYGAIGGVVTGTFSGNLVHIADPSDVKQITNGTFTAERLFDID